MAKSLHPENCTLFSVLLTRAKYLSEWIHLNYLGGTVERPWKITKQEMCGKKIREADSLIFQGDFQWCNQNVPEQAK